ncbi:MAG: LysR family transcriptional regulator, partial [Methylococcaceae bacterium]|nr:LysR family transcriptional regulator [Methylococcaceae bacterium]
MDKINNMKVFCRSVELGTFAAVAKEMNLSAMMISKYVAQLERSLGVILLNRTTRSLNLTEVGQNYYEKSKHILQELTELDDSTSQMGGSVKGVLKISAPIDFGGIYMVPVIEAYQRQCPDVKILMTLDNKYKNLRDGLFDVVILVTDNLDLGVVARKITETELGTYASPSYLKKNGCPERLNELARHQCLHYVNTPHGEYWVFYYQGKVEKVKNELKWGFYFDSWLIDKVPPGFEVKVIEDADGLRCVPESLTCYFGANPIYLNGLGKLWHEVLFSASGIAIYPMFLERPGF